MIIILIDIKAPIIINEYRNIFLKSFSSILLEIKLPINIPKKAVIHEIKEKYDNSKVK